MRLYDEIFKDADGMGLGRYTVAINGGGYFQGLKAVEDFSPQKIVLLYGAGRVEVEGTELAIKKYCDGDLQLSGRILSVKFLSKREG
ncbi:MAG: hypothetical protein E7381_00070 [Clostridiales bacterium]|nr:hypothetical protein [Clostridiales bacterium]